MSRLSDPAIVSNNTKLERETKTFQREAYCRREKNVPLLSYVFSAHEKYQHS